MVMILLIVSYAAHTRFISNFTHLFLHLFGLRININLHFKFTEANDHGAFSLE